MRDGAGRGREGAGRVQGGRGTEGKGEVSEVCGVWVRVLRCSRNPVLYGPNKHDVLNETP